MKKNLFSVLLFTFLLVLVGCNGGGTVNPPIETPKDPSVIVPGNVDNNYAKYQQQSNRVDYLLTYFGDTNKTGFRISISSVVYDGLIQWSSSDGKTVTATLIFGASTPNINNLPTSATIYNFDNKPNSYISYKGFTWYFIGYVA
jgi:hypothetical protein